MNDARRRLAAALALLALAVPTATSAQTLSHLRGGMPSPTAASLGKFGDIPVSLHTGVADISVPLHTAEGRALSLPVTLRYHASGVRVEEMPGWVGLGWALDVGGVITRSMRGLPDENAYVSGTDKALGYFASSAETTSYEDWESFPYYHQEFSNDPDLSQQCVVDGGRVSEYTTDVMPEPIETRRKDGDPDAFYFNFAGRSGQFVGGTPVGGSGTEFRAVPHRDLEFTYTTATYASHPSFHGGPKFDRYISSWTVTDEDGTEYVFSAIEFTRSEAYDASGKLLHEYVGNGYASAWYLTEVRSATGADVITLEYSAPYRVDQPHRERKEWTVDLASGSPGQTHPTTSHTASHTYAVHLTKITTAREEITFQTSPRADVPQAYQLDQVAIKGLPGSTPRRSFSLGYRTESGRLMLGSVTEKGADGSALRPYTFSYYSGLPSSRTSKAVDYWGYANGQTGNDTAPHAPLPDTTLTYQDFYPGSTSAWTHTVNGADRSPSAFAQAGSLGTIRYPTGGSSTFHYEPNDYSYLRDEYLSAGDRVGGGVRVKKVESSDGRGGGTVVEYLYDYNPLVLSGDGDGGRLLPYGIWSKNPAGRSTGVIVHEPQHVYHHEDTTAPGGAVSYAVVSDQSALPLGSGYGVTYQAVTVVRDGRTGGGDPQVPIREVHLFTTANGRIGDWDPALREMEYSDPCARTTARYPEWHGTSWASYAWARGWPVATAYFDAQGEMVSRVERDFVPWSAEGLNGTQTKRFPAVQARSFAGGARRARLYEVVSTTYAMSEQRDFACDGGACHLVTRTTRDNGFGPGAVPTEAPPYQVRSATVEDVATGEERVTSYVYAWSQYPALDSANVLRAVYATSESDGAGGVLSRRWGTWRSDGGRWRPSETWAWRGSSPTDTDAPDDPGGTETVRFGRNESFDTYGRPTSQTDARGDTTSFWYGDNQDNLSNTASGLNNAYPTGVSRGSLSVQYDYDNALSGHVSSIQNEAGDETSFLYDAFGRLIYKYNGNGETVANYSYSLSDGQTDPYGSLANPSYVRTTEYADNSTSYVTTQYVDGLGRPFQRQQQDGPNALVIGGTQRDRAGRVWRTWRPIYVSNLDQGFVSSECDPVYEWECPYLKQALDYYDGSPEADALGRPFTEHRYHDDPLGRPLASIAPGLSDVAAAAQTTYGLEQVGTAWQRYAETVDERGTASRAYTDGFGQTVRTTTAGLTTEYEYDGAGNLVETRDPRGLATTYGYDNLGRLLVEDGPDADSTRYKYDRQGNLRFSQDGNQAASNKAYFTAYDDHDRPVVEGAFPLGTDGAPATFSALGDVHTEGAPTFEGRTANWVRVNRYDGAPSANAFPWDQFERWYGSGTISGVSLANTAGRLAATAYRSGGKWSAELHSYDDDGRVAHKYLYYSNLEEVGGTEEAVRIQISYTYDRQGKVTATTTRVGTWYTTSFYQWYDYDGLGRLEYVYASTSPTKPSAPDVTYTHFADGSVESRRFRAQVTVPFWNDARGRLLTIGDVSSTALPFSARYAYNDDSTIGTAEFHQPGSPSPDDRYRYAFTYDALDRLKAGDYSHDSNNDGVYSGSSTYDLSNVNYDGAGNLTHFLRYKPDYEYDYFDLQYTPGTNRLSTVLDAALYEPVATFSYDANGNVTSSTGLYPSSSGYDEENRPTATGTSTFAYGANGQRFYREAGTTREWYVSDRGGVVGVFGYGPTLRHWNILLPDGRPVGRVASNGARYYYHTDHLGSTRAVVDASGGVVQRYDYYPFGLEMPERISVSGAETREGYTGHELDRETGLNYAGARYYMPSIGRWASVDPLAGDMPDQGGYNYAYNNPITWSDPSGMIPCKDHPDPDMRDMGSTCADGEVVVTAEAPEGFVRMPGAQYVAEIGRLKYEFGRLYPFGRHNFFESAGDYYHRRTIPDYYGGAPTAMITPVGVGSLAPFTSRLSGFGSGSSITLAGGRAVQTFGRVPEAGDIRVGTRLARRAVGGRLQVVDSRLEGGWGGAREFYRQLTGSSAHGTTVSTTNLGALRVTFRSSREGLPTVEIVNFNSGVIEKIRFVARQ